MNSSKLSSIFSNIDWEKLVISLLICNATGLISLYFTMPAIFSWYGSLIKPWFTPPNGVFATSWSIIYILMGISLYLVWEKGWGRRDVKISMAFFGVQLVLNFLWVFFFFGMQSLFLGLIDAILLWLAILVTMWYFYGISKISGLLLIPYFLWVAYAVLLSYYFLVLNP